MKLTRFIAKVTALVLLLNADRALSHKLDSFVRPNSADLLNNVKMLKPMIQKPYIPQEVETLSKQTKRADEPEMQTVQYVGHNNAKKGQQERPSLYESVITPHSTSILHSLPAPTNLNIPRAELNAFNNAAPSRHMAPGVFSTPVRIDNSAKLNDPTMGNYEAPSFIHKKERQVGGFAYDINQIATNPASPLANNQLQTSGANTNLEAQAQNDIRLFVHELSDQSVRTEDQKAKILLNGKNRLVEETKAISNSIENDLKELVQGHEVAQRLEGLLNKYSNKVQGLGSKALQTAGSDAQKADLKVRINKQVTELKNSKSQIKELEAVKPATINHLIAEVHKKLNSL